MAADPAKQMKTNQYVILFMAAVLLFGALNAVFVTADEYGPSATVWLGLGIDALMTVCAVALMIQISSGAPPSGLKTAAMAAGVVALICGLVKLAARFSSDHGWWTGHFNYAL